MGYLYEVENPRHKFLAPKPSLTFLGKQINRFSKGNVRALPWILFANTNYEIKLPFVDLRGLNRSLGIVSLVEERNYIQYLLELNRDQDPSIHLPTLVSRALGVDYIERVWVLDGSLIVFNNPSPQISSPQTQNSLAREA
jgi:hypothetical protein